MTLAFVRQTFGSDTSALASWLRAWQPLVARSAGIRGEAHAPGFIPLIHHER